MVLLLQKQLFKNIHTILYMQNYNAMVKFHCKRFQSRNSETHKHILQHKIHTNASLTIVIFFFDVNYFYIDGVL